MLNCIFFISLHARLAALDDTAQLSRDTDCLEAFIKKGLSLGLFLYGRCLEKGVVEGGKEEDAPVKWYAKVSRLVNY